MNGEYYADSIVYIVIPCYNCADTIERCVKSIVDSAKKCGRILYFILLIDDGSTDHNNTYAILKELDNKNPRVQVYDRKWNDGPGAARNLGFDIIRQMGVSEIDYIWFIDADDYIEPDTFGELYQYITSYVDIICMSRYQNDEEIMPFPNEFYTFDKDKIDIDKLNYIQRVKIIRAAWDKLYRYGICKNEIFAISRRDEESLFTFMAFLNAKDIVTMSNKLYHYDFTDHGLSANLNITDNLSTWWEIADRIRHDDKIRKTYPKLIPYAFEKNAYDISLTLADQMGINIDKDEIRSEVNNMIEYAMWGRRIYNEEMVCSI